MVANNYHIKHFQGQWIANIRRTGFWLRVRGEIKNNFLISQQICLLLVLKELSQ